MNEINQTMQGQSLVLMPMALVEEMKQSLNDVKSMKDAIMAKINDGWGWIESEEGRKLLGVSSKTWQTYRDERVIPFSQFGRKIYVKKADIEAFLQSHTIKN